MMQAQPRPQQRFNACVSYYDGSAWETFESAGLPDLGTADSVLILYKSPIRFH